MYQEEEYKEEETQQFVNDPTVSSTSYDNSNYYNNNINMNNPNTNTNTNPNINYNNINYNAQSQAYNEYSTSATTPGYSNQIPNFTSNPHAQQPQKFSNINSFDNVDISKGPNGKFSSGTPFETVHGFVSVSNKKFQNFLDSTTPHTGPRWLIFTFLLLIFILRIIFYEGFYVVAYALGIYLLNIFLLFLSPKFDPAAGEDESALDNEASLYYDDDGTDLLGNNVNGNNLSGTPLIDEFRPFVRRLPEFKFWYNAITSLLFGLFCTLFSFLDIPVFWPILLMYFVLLFALTMRRQIQHMIKYKYLPFDLGKKAYA